MTSLNSTVTLQGALDRLSALTLGELFRSPYCLARLVQLYLGRHKLGRFALDQPLVLICALALPVVLLYGVLKRDEVKEVEWVTPKVS